MESFATEQEVKWDDICPDKMGRVVQDEVNRIEGEMKMRIMDVKKKDTWISMETRLLESIEGVVIRTIALVTEKPLAGVWQLLRQDV